MDTTWSVRMPEELREKISNLISESGLNSKDFLNQLVQAYILKETSNLQPLAGADIEELSHITGRINNIFINLLERFGSFQKQMENEFNSKIDEKNEIFMVINGKVKKQEEIISHYEAETLSLKNQNEEIRVQHSHITEAYEANKALILEYKEKNETLSGLLTTYKEYKDTINNIKADFEKEKELRIDTQSKLNNAEKELTTLKELFEEERKAFDLKLQQEMERSELQNERRILEINKDYQKKLIAEQEIYSTKVRELLSAIEKTQGSKNGKKSAGVNASS